MKRRLSGYEAERQWKVLLQQVPKKGCYHNIHNNTLVSSSLSSPSPLSNNDETKNNNHKYREDKRRYDTGNDDDNDDIDDTDTTSTVDPFDCQDIAVPPTHALVQSALTDATKQWKALDDRKIARFKAPTRGPQSHLKLPRNFDFFTTNGGATTTSMPPPPSQSITRTASKDEENNNNYDNNNNNNNNNNNDDDDDEEDQVVSLIDPSKRLSYAVELHKLFDTIPTAEQLERKARSGSKLRHSTKLYKESLSLVLQQQHGDDDKRLLPGKKQKKEYGSNSMMASRLRRSDRHGLPPPPPPNNNNNNSNTKTSTSTTQCLLLSSSTTTIRLECWKRQLKRGTSPDAGRMVLEFLASQTLLDVHRAIIQLLEDDFWDTTTIINNEDDGDSKDDEDDNGCFFIENVFYTTTSAPSTTSSNSNNSNKNKKSKVDYVTPILKWIDGSNGSPNPTRRGYLGLSMNSKKEFPTKSMKDTVLGDISVRLGIRYYHVCHGDVETAIMVTDKRLLLVPQKDVETSSSSSYRRCYPLLHDIWTSPYPLAFCDACRNQMAMYVTAPDCELTDGGPRQLCEHCCNLLGLNNNNNNNNNKNDNNNVQLYSTWRNEADLSTSATMATTTTSTTTTTKNNGD